MKIPMRLALLALILGLCLFLGILFNSFVFDSVIRPIAVLLWVIWQIVQSVDQGIYWGALIFAALAYAARRLTRNSSTPR